MAITKVTHFKCKDGKTFSTAAAAENHEAFLALETWVEAHGICKGGEWTAEMVIHELLAGASSLINLLEPFTNYKVITE